MYNIVQYYNKIFYFVLYYFQEARKKLDCHCCQSHDVAIPAITNSQDIRHLLGKIPFHNVKLKIIKVTLFLYRRSSRGAEGSEEGN
jgi:hypothetical protein